MGNRAVRMGMTLWLAGCFWHADCQSAVTTAQPDPNRFRIYQRFFHQVWEERDTPKDAPVLLRASPAIAAALADRTGAAPKDTRVLLNGQPTDLKLPNVRTDVGLSDPEMHMLREIAANCESKVESLNRILRPVMFDYLIESIQLGEDTSTPLQQRRQELYDQIDLVVRDHVVQLKTALGASRFEKLDAFVRTPEPGRLPPDFKAQ
jgi:hypothetical protein